MCHYNQQCVNTVGTYRCQVRCGPGLKPSATGTSCEGEYRLSVRPRVLNICRKKARLPNRFFQTWTSARSRPCLRVSTSVSTPSAPTVVSVTLDTSCQDTAASVRPPHRGHGWGEGVALGCSPVRVSLDPML